MSDRYAIPGSAHTKSIGNRTADGFAGFFLANLHPGMSVLDCGCGPGSITMDLAEAVAPAEVVGIDAQAQAVEMATKTAAERGITNVRFETADIYRLPFEAGQFDAASAFAVLQHLGDPLAAMREIRRVVRPGGLVGIRDPDWATFIREPSNPRLEQRQRLNTRLIEHNGGSPFYARQLGTLMLEAGFADVRISVAANSLSGPATPSSKMERTAFSAAVHAVAIEKGWVDEATWLDLEEAVDEWLARPDGFWAVLIIEALGRV